MLTNVQQQMLMAVVPSPGDVFENPYITECFAACDIIVGYKLLDIVQ